MLALAVIEHSLDQPGQLRFGVTVQPGFRIGIGGGKPRVAAVETGHLQ